MTLAIGAICGNITKGQSHGYVTGDSLMTNVVGDLLERSSTTFTEGDFSLGISPVENATGGFSRDNIPITLAICVGCIKVFDRKCCWKPVVEKKNR